MDQSNPTPLLDREAIQAEIKRRGSSLATIAREAGLHRTSMYWALNTKPHLRANKAIADFLGVPMHALWPQWFDEDGKIISTQPIQRQARDLTASPVAPSSQRNLAA